MKYTLRPLTALDARSTKDIFHEVFHQDDWSELGWIWRYRSKRESIGVFNSTGELLGFALILPHSRKLKYLGVHPNFQLHGFGSILLKDILKSCVSQRRSLNLVPANEIVEAWYRRHGFYTSRYFIATDNTRWSTMNYHPYSTRSKNLKPNYSII